MASKTDQEETEGKKDLICFDVNTTFSTRCSFQAFEVLDGWLVG